jgi:glycosyltransferase involved in cell wall biosynthesis
MLLQDRFHMKVLWICGLPQEVQDQVLHGENFGAYAAWSWVMGHLPPPEGVELHIACRTARRTEYRQFSYKGTVFHLVPVRARARLLSLYQLDWLFFRDVVSRVRPEVVHGWGTEDSFSWCALRLAPRSHLVQIQGNINTYRKRVPMSWPGVILALSERMVLARARHVVAENQYSLDSALPFIRTRSVHVVEHPIRSEFLEGLPATGDAKQILFVGALQERKGIWDAIEVFHRAAPLDWKLAIVGDGPQEVLDRLSVEIAERQLEDRVTHFQGRSASEIVALMRQSSVFLLPTRIDTGPTALKEALSMGLWPICYNNSGPAHYLNHFKVGVLADDLNPRALEAALKDALSTRPWKAPSQKTKTLSLIRPSFAPAGIWRQLLQLYSRIASDRPE